MACRHADEKRLQGLRVLARMIAAAHMRRLRAGEPVAPSDRDGVSTDDEGFEDHPYLCCHLDGSEPEGPEHAQA